MDGSLRRMPTGSLGWVNEAELYAEGYFRHTRDQALYRSYPLWLGPGDRKTLLLIHT